jgi:hypothetical protein
VRDFTGVFRQAFGGGRPADAVDQAGGAQVTPMLCRLIAHLGAPLRVSDFILAHGNESLET